MDEYDSDTTTSEISLAPVESKQWGVSLNKATRVVRKRKRIPFTDEVDEWILDFVKERSSAEYTVGGNRLWQLMESEDPSGHSWHSLRSRYTKFLAARKQKKEQHQSSVAKLRALRPVRAPRNCATDPATVPPKSPGPVSAQRMASPVPNKSRAAGVDQCQGDDVFEQVDADTADQFGVDSPDLPERFAATTPQESKSEDEKSPGLLRPVDHAGSDSYINRFNKEVNQGLEKKQQEKKHQGPVQKNSLRKSSAKGLGQRVAAVPEEVKESPEKSPQQLVNDFPDPNFEFEEAGKAATTAHKDVRSAAEPNHDTDKDADMASAIELTDADKRRVVRSMCDLSMQPISVVMHALIVHSGDVDRAFEYLTQHEEVHPNAWSVEEDALLQSTDEDPADFKNRIAALIEQRGQAPVVERIAWLEAVENQD